MEMMIMGIPMKDMNKPPEAKGMEKHGSMCPESTMKHMCPEMAPSIQIEDPINGSDTKSIEIGIFGPRWE